MEMDKDMLLNISSSSSSSCDSDSSYDVNVDATTSTSNTNATNATNATVDSTNIDATTSNDNDRIRSRLRLLKRKREVEEIKIRAELWGILNNLPNKMIADAFYDLKYFSIILNYLNDTKWKKLDESDDKELPLAEVNRYVLQFNKFQKFIQFQLNYIIDLLQYQMDELNSHSQPIQDLLLLTDDDVLFFNNLNDQIFILKKLKNFKKNLYRKYYKNHYISFLNKLFNRYLIKCGFKIDIDINEHKKNENEHDEYDEHGVNSTNSDYYRVQHLIKLLNIKIDVSNILNHF